MFQQTKWNKKLQQFAGQRVSCNEFEKDGISTDYYRIQKDGSLNFYNDLRSLPANTRNAYGFKNYWSNKKKSNFLKVLQSKTKIMTK